jgi:Flp pilus assembly protein TadD/predicted RNA methylase
MELTIDQKLQQAITAHIEGKLQEAERIYRDILQAQPAHPDANHNLGIIAVSANEAEAALPFFKAALEANPKIEQYWLSYIDTLIKKQHIESAKQALCDANEAGVDIEKLNALTAQLMPTVKGKAPSQEQLADLLEYYQAGRYGDAEKLAVSLTKKFPEHPSGWKVLGAVLKQIGKSSEAVNASQMAVTLSPQDAEAHSNLGVMLQEQGRLNEAEVSCRKAIALRPEYAEAHYNLGVTLNEQGKPEEAIEAYNKALAGQPHNADILQNLSTAKRNAVPDWHIPMMNDHGRNEAYLKALNSAIRGNEVVLDIGTGAGLLSMMAADCGAKEIITCEMSKSISETAEKIIQKNGLNKKIRVINKNSKDLIFGQDIDKKVDILVSEILSSEFVGEGIQSTILDAKKRLLKKTGKMIPEGGSIMIALIENTGKLSKEFFVNNVSGYDISDFNSLITNMKLITLEDEPVFLSNPIEAFTFDFCNFEKIYTDKKTIEIVVNKTGSCAGIIQWIKVQLYDDIEYQNNPVEMHQSNSVSGWKTPIFKFNNPVNVTKGQTLNIQANLQEDISWFHLNPL